MKYFSSDEEAINWAASKLQAIVRSRNERREVAQKRRDMEEAAKLLVDACKVKVITEVEAGEGYEELQVLIKSRRFKECAGDGDIAEMKRLLKLKKGSLDPNIKGYRDETAAHRAAENGHREALELAFENGLDIDAVTSIGNTAAHFAAMGGSNDCIRLLSDNLADIMKKNLNEETPIGICESRGKESTMALINALAVEGEDLVMRRRRVIELRRQNEIRRKKSVLFGRDIVGSEGASEFTVPSQAYLNNSSKYGVACGLRASAFVESSSKNGLFLATPQVMRERRKIKERKEEMEVVRSMNFLLGDTRRKQSLVL
ncbi:hypothetical protein TrCOL_g10986 [Triparma columacea]|uniref:Uncharacterized protein n=1 Tax=Triparma columacea TaxID=722753 RepID=A0A9W7G6D7_9STRA|nr:hypothetical protein TrCOL_g10986 [Triparma columacea]